MAIDPVTFVSLLTELIVVLGSRAAASTPEVILTAFVVSIVAEGTKESPLVFVQVTALDPEVVQSPDNSVELRAAPLERSKPAAKLDCPVPPALIPSVPAMSLN